jgi:hypothetical protein
MPANRRVPGAWIGACVPGIVRRYRGLRQGTDNERFLALGGGTGSRVAVESASASTAREPHSCCSTRKRGRRTNPAAHRGRGSTSACPQEQQRRASRFSSGRAVQLRSDRLGSALSSGYSLSTTFPRGRLGSAAATASCRRAAGMLVDSMTPEACQAGRAAGLVTAFHFASAAALSGVS